MPAPQSHIRTDVLTGRQVIVATGRDSRPIHVGTQTPEPSTGIDLFLEGNEHSTPSESLALRRSDSSVDKTGWLLRVVPNRYPAVGAPLAVEPQVSDVFPQQSAVGIHEVVVECPDSQTRLAQMSVVSVSRVLLAWQKRIQQLGTMFPVINIFRNEGFGAGASLPHCHSQILAGNEYSSALNSRLEAEQQYRELNQASLFQSWLDAEIEQQSRIVRLSYDFAAVCPFASRFPWQVRFCPRRQETASFNDLSAEQLIELATNLLTVSRSLDAIRQSMSFNLTLTLPPADQSGAIPWMLDLMPRPNRFAGFEIMTDVDINTVLPESAARIYRDSAESLSPCTVGEICPAGYEWRQQS